MGWPILWNSGKHAAPVPVYYRRPAIRRRSTSPYLNFFGFKVKNQHLKLYKRKLLSSGVVDETEIYYEKQNILLFHKLNILHQLSRLQPGFCYPNTFTCNTFNNKETARTKMMH